VELKGQKEIATVAFHKVMDKYSWDESYVKQHFDSLVDEIEHETYQTYLAYEKEYGRQVINLLVDRIRGKGADIDSIGERLGDHFHDFDDFFQSMAQSRNARAGSAFELNLRSLFKLLGYPFDEQQVINGKPDFLLPSRTYYDKHATDCIIFTVKRTLRERWRQITIEGKRGFLFLATIDKKISKNALEEMKKNSIQLVCPASVKEACYSGAYNVMTFSEFFHLHLDPAMNRWRHAGVI
jgi:hypothetical protein